MSTDRRRDPVSPRRILLCVGFEVFTAVTMKNAVTRDVAQCDLVTTDVSEERVASVFRVEKILEREMYSTFANRLIDTFLVSTLKM
jgi:hypothetical protein